MFWGLFRERQTERKTTWAPVRSTNMFFLTESPWTEPSRWFPPPNPRFKFITLCYANHLGPHAEHRAVKNVWISLSDCWRKKVTVDVSQSWSFFFFFQKAETWAVMWRLLTLCFRTQSPWRLLRCLHMQTNGFPTSWLLPFPNRSIICQNLSEHGRWVGVAESLRSFLFICCTLRENSACLCKSGAITRFLTSCTCLCFLWPFCFF